MSPRLRCSIPYFWENTDKRQIQNLKYAEGFFAKSLRDANTDHVCSLCKRELDDHDLHDFAKRVLALGR